MTARSASPDNPLGPVAGELSARVGRFVREQGVPGLVAGLVVDDTLAWSTCLGSTDLAAGRSPDAGTLFRIASITKTFTATAIVQLRDEERLRLDDPLVCHLPEFGAARNPFGPIEAVTLERLLRHTSGLQGEDPNRDPREWTLLPPAELVRVVDRVTVAIPPGSAYKYSNLGFSLLGLVVERVSGRSYREYLHDAILDPLGMTSTTLDPRGLAERRATGYRRRRFDDAVEPATVIPAGILTGAGGLWSSLEDLARWVTQQLRTDRGLRRGPGQVLAGASLAEMHRPTVLTDGSWNEAYGLGWSILRKDGRSVVGHGGTIHGYQSSIRFVPPDRVGAVVLQNGLGREGPGTLAWSLLELALPAVGSVRERATGQTPPHPAPPAWRELLGIYVDEEFADATRIEVRDGRLVAVDETDGELVELVPTDDPLAFRVETGRAAGEAYRFLRGADGRIDGLNMYGFPLVRLVEAR